jgi:hypothetical protein
LTDNLEIHNMANLSISNTSLVSTTAMVPLGEDCVDATPLT